MKKLLWYLPAIAWAGMIFVLSSRPVLGGTGIFLLSDFILKKIAHIAVFGMLFFWLLVGRSQGFRLYLTYKQQAVLMLIVLAYAFFDELHQSFTPGRVSSARDVGYDFLGAGLIFLRVNRYI